jgi:hypothetical protein
MLIPLIASIAGQLGSTFTSSLNLPYSSWNSPARLSLPIFSCASSRSLTYVLYNRYLGAL